MYLLWAVKPLPCNRNSLCLLTKKVPLSKFKGKIAYYWVMCF